MNTDLIWQTTCVNSSQTEKLGLILGEILQPPCLIELKADVGGGKTTLIKGLAKGLGVKEKISSPTFNIVREYQAKNGYKLFHFDIYRLDEPGIIANQISEVMDTDMSTIIAVEWPQSISGILPENKISLQITADPSESNKRHIKILFAQEYKNLLPKIKKLWKK